MSTIDLEGLARKLAYTLWPEYAYSKEGAKETLLAIHAPAFGRVLRESKLPELIAAGQAMRSSIKRADNYESDLRAAEDWREALAAFLAATLGKQSEGDSNG